MKKRIAKKIEKRIIKNILKPLMEKGYSEITFDTQTKKIIAK